MYYRHYHYLYLYIFKLLLLLLLEIMNILENHIHTATSMLFSISSHHFNMISLRTSYIKVSSLLGSLVSITFNYHLVCVCFLKFLVLLICSASSKIREKPSQILKHIKPTHIPTTTICALQKEMTKLKLHH